MVTKPLLAVLLAAALTACGGAAGSGAKKAGLSPADPESVRLLNRLFGAWLSVVNPAASSGSDLMHPIPQQLSASVMTAPACR